MFNLRKYEDYIQSLAHKNKIIIDDVTATIENNVLCISVCIDWGDWKHDHLRLKNLIYKELKPDDCFEKIIETRRTNCYFYVSSTLTFIWHEKKDTCTIEE